jgi:VanZ family protein
VINVKIKTKFLGHCRKNPWLLLAWTFYGLMIVLASFKSLERSFIWTFNDKLLHFLAYAVLSAMIFWGWSNKPFLPRLITTLTILGVLGAFDELLQNFTNRDPSFDDWLADMAGAILSLAAIASLMIVRWLWRTYQNGNWEQAFTQLIHPQNPDFDED